jgi:hypothetical protein
MGGPTFIWCGVARAIIIGGHDVLILTGPGDDDPSTTCLYQIIHTITYKDGGGGGGGRDDDQQGTTVPPFQRGRQQQQ